MELGGWCGRCGQRFRLEEVAEPPAPGSCPRCGRAFASGYAAVVVSAVRRLQAAAAEAALAKAELADVAPHLHVEDA